MPKKTRKYNTKQKTTTKQGKKDYQRQYMRDYRAFEREILRKAKKEFDLPKLKAKRR